MNIVMILKLKDMKAATYSHYLADVDRVSKLVVIREKEGKFHPKIRYVTPPSFLKDSNLLKTLFNGIMLFYITLRHNPRFIYGVHLYPHGFLAWIVASILKKPFIISFIAGRGEINQREENHYFFRKIRRKLAIIVAKKAYLILNTGGSEIFSDLKSIGIENRKIIPFYSSVECHKFFPISNVQKIWDLMIVASLDEVKRVDIFLELVKLVSTKLNITAAVVGDGPLKDTLTRYAKELGIDSFTEFLGNIDHKKINEVLNTTKIFVLTSKSEGLPSVLVEAMCAGICCVSSNVGSISNVIQNYYNGFLVDKFDDVDTYVDIINRLLIDKKLLRNVSLNATNIRHSVSSENRTKIWEQILV